MSEINIQAIKERCEVSRIIGLCVPPELYRQDVEQLLAEVERLRLEVSITQKVSALMIENHLKCAGPNRQRKRRKRNVRD